MLVNFQGCGHFFKKNVSLGDEEALFGGIVRKYLSNVHLPTTTICNKQLVTDMIKAHKDEENRSQDKKNELIEQRLQKIKDIENFKKEIQNAKEEFDEDKKKDLIQKESLNEDIRRYKKEIELREATIYYLASQMEMKTKETESKTKGIEGWSPNI